MTFDTTAYVAFGCKINSLQALEKGQHHFAQAFDKIQMLITARITFSGKAKSKTGTSLHISTQTQDRAQILQILRYGLYATAPALACENYTFPHYKGHQFPGHT